MGCFVLTLLAGYVVRALLPDSSLGHFLGSWDGALIAFVVAWFSYVVANVVITLAGYPCFVRDSGSHVQSNVPADRCAAAELIR